MNIPSFAGAVRAWATYCVAAFLAFAPLTSVAQAQGTTGTITGRVLNETSGEYLRNAVVTVVGTTITATAGDGGNYRLFDVPAGAQTLRFTYAGLETKD